MTGRVLIGRITRLGKIKHPVYDFSDDSIRMLERTIRDRDEEIKRAHENNALLTKGLSDVETENTTLREALERIRDLETLNSMASNTFNGVNTDAESFGIFSPIATIAREALAKVSQKGGFLR